MVDLIAQVADDPTWGIPGPTFAWGYLALVVGTGIVIGLIRRGIQRGSDVSEHQLAAMHPYEAAYLTGGGELAAALTVVTLHRQGVVVADNATGASLAGLASLTKLAGDDAAWIGGTTRLVVAGRPGPGSHPLDRAAVRLVSDDPSLRPDGLQLELRRAPEMEQLRAGLLQRELLLAPEQRTRSRIAGLLWLPTIAVGAARVHAGLSNDRPVAFVTIELAAAVVWFLAALASVPEVAGRARRAVGRTRSSIAPDRAAAVASLSSGSPFGRNEAFAVALLGTAVLWSADPAAAAVLGLPRLSPGSAGVSSGGSGCGGGDGGGGGCGSGGGCGGGGCGG